jgi:hypothetical protein
VGAELFHAVGQTHRQVDERTGTQTRRSQSSVLVTARKQLKMRNENLRMERANFIRFVTPIVFICLPGLILTKLSLN